MNISTPMDRGWKRNPPPSGFIHPFKAMAEGIPPIPHYPLSPYPITSSSSHSDTIKRDSPISTSSTTGIGTEKGRRWVVSAARRVGFTRIPDRTPRSRKKIPEEEGTNIANMKVSA
jgi:hypothetical protein